jgi:hypothetical protein
MSVCERRPFVTIAAREVKVLAWLTLRKLRREFRLDNIYIVLWQSKRLKIFQYLKQATYSIAEGNMFP